MSTTDAFKGRHPLNRTAGEMIEAIREAGHGMMTVTCHGAHEGAIVVILDGEDAPLYQRLLDKAQEVPHAEDIEDAIALLDKVIAEDPLGADAPAPSK